MITLRKFNASDEETICSKMNVPADVAKRLILEWDTTQYQGRYFEMFAIAEGDTAVGTISLYELSQSIISIGIEVFEEYRQHGYARAAMQQAIQLAQAKKYPVAFQQVRVDNPASIRLHESLGFEKEDSVYTNKKGRDVYLFVKALQQGDRMVGA